MFTRRAARGANDSKSINELLGEWNFSINTSLLFWQIQWNFHDTRWKFYKLNFLSKHNQKILIKIFQYVVEQIFLCKYFSFFGSNEYVGSLKQHATW